MDLIYAFRLVRERGLCALFNLPSETQKPQKHNGSFGPNEEEEKTVSDVNFPFVMSFECVLSPGGVIKLPWREMNY